MADSAAPAPQTETRGRGFGRGRGGDKKPAGPKGGASSRAGGGDVKEWVPCTKLGRLVKSGKVTTLEEIFLFSMPIKEYQIVDQFFAPGTLKDRVESLSE